MSEVCPDCGRKRAHDGHTWNVDFQSARADESASTCGAHLSSNWIDESLPDCHIATMAHLRSQLTAALAKVTELESSKGDHCAACGAVWLPDSACSGNGQSWAVYVAGSDLGIFQSAPAARRAAVEYLKARMAERCPNCEREYAPSYPLWQCSDTSCGMSPDWNEDGENHDDCINECLYTERNMLREKLAAQTDIATRAQQESATACGRMRASKADLRARLAKLEAERDAMAKVIEAANEVVRISDRKHDAWDGYKAAKAELEKLRSQGEET